ncbi:MAG: hypothetical protein LH614_10990, partial [Pyrinomonadaceae bacterium]|nr:hypothetical protein [Pyrinomonadaceae bacterium]
MPKLTQAEIRQNAVEFVHEWKDESSEYAESQSFWNHFFTVFGFSRRRIASFEEGVKLLGSRRGRIDVFWKGKMIAEMKSRGRNLDKAFTQATEYFEGLKENDLPKFVLVSDFARFRLYDLDEGIQQEFPIEEFPDKIHLFGFISGYEKREYKDQDPVNIKVAEQIGKLHDALLASGYTDHKLEIFLVRLVYCLFADDTGIFPKDHFRFFLEEKTFENGSNVGAMIGQIFEIVDTSPEERQRTLDEELQQFPHVNGTLFKEQIRLPVFDAKMREILIDACSFDWSKVSPAIFGSLFQSVMDKTKRRNLGAHYTSEKNILKVVRGLFLDDLYKEFESIKHSAARLRQFHSRLERLKFFDPACGCGNFLVITYREMRQLEIEILKQLRALTGEIQLELDASKLSVIDVDSFYGIEYEEFPAQIATVALWLTDHQANMALSAEFGRSYARLPLVKSANIHHANALRLDWHEVVSPEGNTAETNLYILGNPPFVGKDKRSAEQTADMAFSCGDVPSYATLDYVTAWYIKAAKFIQNTHIKVAFVSTNSITQGEQTAILWSYLLSQGVRINFAHRTFKWNNEARGNATVQCVIIGFALFDESKKRLFDYQTPAAEPHEIQVKNINPYLIDYANLIIPTRRAPLCDVPEMIYGNKPVDDGNFFLTKQEKAEFLAREPKAEKFIRKILGAEEFINGIDRYCLWLKGVPPTEWRSLPAVVERVQAVRAFREKSKKAATVKLADIPYLFAEIRQPASDFLLVPRVSSENRRYVPIGFMSREVVVNDLVSIVPNATLYHFGVMTSQMHNAWMRQVCGRLESRYRYSNNLVYNNFPF